MDVVRYLGARSHGKLVTLSVILGEGGMGFRLNLAHFRTVILRLVDKVGSGKSGFNITDFELDMPLNVTRSVIVKIDRVFRHGVFGREIGRKFFITNLDEITGRTGNFD